MKPPTSTRPRKYEYTVDSGAENRPPELLCSKHILCDLESERSRIPLYNPSYLYHDRSSFTMYIFAISLGIFAVSFAAARPFSPVLSLGLLPR